jgi:glycosyltransferase involved in cell wall biosynthesis
MIHLFINALAASAGGGLTYIRNVVPCLARRPDVRTTLRVSAKLQSELGDWPSTDLLTASPPAGTAARFWHEQQALPRVIRRSGADVLLSTGNFALWRSPVPQILLSRNALYTSFDFERDLRTRGDWQIWLDTKIKGAFAKASIQHADVTVAPSAAFAAELKQWTGKNVVAIHHGFDLNAFTQNQSPLSPEVQAKLDTTSANLRLLFVSHYNYYRNFETLIRALPLLRDRLAPRKVSLVLTCQLRSEANPGSYRADSAAALVHNLGVADNVVELGSVPYSLLHHVYRCCDVYVTPAYAESFAHPLVEAMATGLPIAASDIPVHREICGQAACYFPLHSPTELSRSVANVAALNLGKQQKRENARQFRHLSWDGHVEAILALAQSLRSAP